jgi:hypothetical protein
MAITLLILITYFHFSWKLSEISTSHTSQAPLPQFGYRLLCAGTNDYIYVLNLNGLYLSKQRVLHVPCY